MLLVATGGEVCRGGTQQGRPRNRAGFSCSLCRWECAPALAVGRDDVSAVVSLCWCQLNGLAWILEVSISLVLFMSCVPRDLATHTRLVRIVRLVAFIWLVVALTGLTILRANFRALHCVSASLHDCHQPELHRIGLVLHCNVS